MNKLELQKTANEIRKGIVTAVHSAKAGHPADKGLDLVYNLLVDRDHQRIVYDYLHALFLLRYKQYITVVNCCQVLYTVYFKILKKENWSVCYRKQASQFPFFSLYILK